MSAEKLLNRMFDVIEKDIVPLTAKGVEIGCKVFGAAVLRRSDLSLVLSATNHEAMSPLWHGEVYTIKQFFEMQGHPDPADCIFISTHQPCCMCTSALAWSGFKEIYYLFGYDQTGADFNIPHDQKMIRDVFGCTEPNPKNSYFEWTAISKMIEQFEDPAPARMRYEQIHATYAKLSATYQAGEKKMILK